jgi:hypothetical protein
MRHIVGDILLGKTAVRLISKYDNKYKCDTILNQVYPLFQSLITIKMTILIELTYPVYPDSILNDVFVDAIQYSMY